ncbi:AzlD domain-containing protein [Thalassobacillus pellis]|uniref:AzlD domain-containing protein n=1 Tax=Thalassobacillus pellis TaxID=748008 RepID=UPI001961EB18|nr:AzlD domain-containing protein [Thalassobacillus pellis]MBM7551134.1 branched-subunit amino acid transport protein [Thalassobacillus pellis]
MIWIIVGMALVTAIPRVVPAFIVDKLRFPGWVDRWLNAIPYAALGALIFPGIINVKPESPHIGITAGIIAIGLAWAGLNIILVVIGAITTVFLMTL